MNRKLVSFGCALALVGNSLTAFAQNPVPDKSKTERRDVITSNTFSLQLDGEPSDHFTLFDHAIAAPAIALGAGQAGFQYGFTASIDHKVVKGQPYSADVVTEHIQTLGDGNRIVRRSNASVARDSEGRTRQEAIVMAFGPLAEAMRDLPKHVTIYDPVAGTTYMLNPKDKTAQKVGSVMIRKVEAKPSTNAAPKTEGSSAMPRTQRVSGGVLQGNAVRKVQPPYPELAKAAGAEGAVQVSITVNENGEVTTTEAVSGHPLLKEAALEAARQWKFKQTELDGKPVKVQGLLTFNFTLEGGASKEARERAMAEHRAAQGERLAIALGDKVQAEMKMTTEGQLLTMDWRGDQNFQFFGNNKKYETRKESLGKQTLEGVECDGTRNVTTIPAGEMGNELPINIVTETWYSPDLQVTVLRKFNDPRYGEDVYRLTNITRAEPAKELFEVPSDYTIKENRGMFFNDKIGEEMRMRMKEVEEKMRNLQER